MQAEIGRGRGARLVVTLAALSTLLLGYYLGQWWQRRGLDDLAAIVYPTGHALHYPAGLFAEQSAPDDAWRLFGVVDTREPACRDLIRHGALIINRLAHRPTLQQRLRIALLAYDTPPPDQVAAIAADSPWLEIVSAAPAELDMLSGQLGLLPSGGPWCKGTQANAVLVAPDRTAWALIPAGEAAIMAHEIAVIVDFVE